MDESNCIIPFSKVRTAFHIAAQIRAYPTKIRTIRARIGLAVHAPYPVNQGVDGHFGLR